MKYLLIVHDVYQNDNNFPLAEAYLASILRKDGHQVDILCMDIYHHTEQQLIYYLKHSNYDIIGLGFMAARFKETIIPLCEIINKYKGKAKLILGGHGPSSIPFYMLSKTNADGVVIGEAESVISNISNLIENSQIIMSKPIKDLDKIPKPAWDLFPMNEYIRSKKYPGQNNSQKSLSLITSRGCVNKCTFCYRMEKGLRLRSLNDILMEIQHLHDKYDIDYFEFADECFILNKKRLEKFIGLLRDNNLNINYSCASRVTGIDEEILELLKESGCKFINYGFESMDRKVLKEIKKNATPEDNEKTAELTYKANIPFGVNFIWGYPSDNEETLINSVNFIKKYNSKEQCRTIRPVTPYPGSELYYDAIDKGLLTGPEDFFNRFKNSDLITVNFTNLDICNMYEMLYDANKHLIDNHFRKGGISRTKAEELTDAFYNLYFGGGNNFRGARHYEK